MELDNLSLAYLLQELRPFLEGAYVNKVSEIRNGFLKLKLHTKQGSNDLIITPNALFITRYSIPARHGKTNFAVALKKELYNKRIVAVEQHDSDRVVEIKFLQHTLVLEFIGAGNKILVGKNGKVIACERNEKWSDRETRKGSEYMFPKAQGINPAKVTVLQLRNAFKSSNKDVIRALLSTLNIQPILGEEVLLRAGMQKSLPANSLNDTHIKKIVEALDDFYSLHEKPSPVAYNDFVCPFRFHGLKEEPKQVGSINSFLEELIARQLSSPHEAPKKTEARKSRESSHEFMQRQQEDAGKRFMVEVQENQKKAELIYQHYNEIEELRNAVLSGLRSGLSEKQTMERISGEARKGNRAAAMLKRIDAKKRAIEVEL